MCWKHGRKHGWTIGLGFDVCCFQTYRKKARKNNRQKDRRKDKKEGRTQRNERMNKVKLAMKHKTQDKEVCLVLADCP